jgi:hypothetical protein
MNKIQYREYMREYMRNYRKLKKTHFEISNRASNKAWHAKKKATSEPHLPPQTVPILHPNVQ